MPLLKTGRILTVLILIALAGAALNCSSRTKDVYGTMSEMGDTMLLKDPFEAIHLDGFTKTRGHILLSKENLIFFDGERENPSTVYPLDSCSDFSIRIVHMVGTILSFTFDNRIESFMLNDDRMILINALGNLVHLDSSN